jgi:hypothetical protein
MSCSLDRPYQLALVFGARARNPLGDDFSLLRHKAKQFLLIPVIDVDLFGVAKTACAFLP